MTQVDCDCIPVGYFEIPLTFVGVSFSFNSKGSVKLYNVPIGGKIPELSHFKPQEDERAWPKELAVSALYYTGELTIVTKHFTLTAATVKRGKPQQEI